MSAWVTRFADVARSPWSGLIRRLVRYHRFIVLVGYHRVISLSVVLFLFLLLVLWPWIVVTVPAGHVAVRWWRLFGGTDISRVYGEGSHFNFPWDTMSVYDARIQQIDSDFDVLTSDGMVMTVNVAIRFRLNSSTVGLLHKNVGSNYVNTLVLPAVGTYARQTFSEYVAEDAYAAQRLSIQDRIKQAVIKDLMPHEAEGRTPLTPWIRVDDVLIRSMRFPPAVEAAINRKMEQYQIQKEYAYRLERERLESERKRVEAEGIAQFQQIVGAGISSNYLRWKGIDATLALAQSPNSKIVVIGTPKDGMPLILGNGETVEPPSVLPAPQSDQGQTARAQ